MTTDEVLIFKVETETPVRSHDWETSYESFPKITRFGWWSATAKKAIVYDTEAIPFPMIVDNFIGLALTAPMICGFNVHAEVAALKAGILRLFGREYYDAFNVETALWKGKRIDLMRQSSKFVDARTPDGQPKVPNLREVCFRARPGMEWSGEGMAYELQMMAEVLPTLVDLKVIALEPRAYDENGRPKPRPGDVIPEDWAAKGPNLATKEESNKSHGKEAKAQNTGLSKKITDEVGEKLLRYHERRVEEAKDFGNLGAEGLHRAFIQWIKEHGHE